MNRKEQAELALLAGLHISQYDLDSYCLFFLFVHSSQGCHSFVRLFGTVVLCSTLLASCFSTFISGWIADRTARRIHLTLRLSCLCQLLVSAVAYVLCPWLLRSAALSAEYSWLHLPGDFWVVLFVVLRGQVVVNNRATIWKVVKLRVQFTVGASNVQDQEVTLSRIGSIADAISDIYEGLLLFVSFLVASGKLSFLPFLNGGEDDLWNSTVWMLFGNLLMVDVVLVILSLTFVRSDKFQQPLQQQQETEEGRGTENAIELQALMKDEKEKAVEADEADEEGTEEKSEEEEIRIDQENTISTIVFAKEEEEVEEIRSVFRWRSFLAYWKGSFSQLRATPVAINAIIHGWASFGLALLALDPIMVVRVNSSNEPDGSDDNAKEEDSTPSNFCNSFHINLLLQGSISNAAYLVGALSYFFFLVKCPPLLFHQRIYPALGVLLMLGMASLWLVPAASMLNFVIVAITAIVPYYVFEYDYYLSTSAVHQRLFGFTHGLAWSGFNFEKLLAGLMLINVQVTQKFVHLLLGLYITVAGASVLHSVLFARRHRERLLAHQRQQHLQPHRQPEGDSSS
ncbi:hypothetical protein QOT17_019484 [Balamuthia mandrillaris]